MVDADGYTSIRNLVWNLLISFMDVRVDYNMGLQISGRQKKAAKNFEPMSEQVAA